MGFIRHVGTHIFEYWINLVTKSHSIVTYYPFYILLDLIYQHFEEFLHGCAWGRCWWKKTAVLMLLVSSLLELFMSVCTSRFMLRPRFLLPTEFLLPLQRFLQFRSDGHKCALYLKKLFLHLNYIIYTYIKVINFWT